MNEIWLQANRRAAIGPSIAMTPFAVGSAVGAYRSFVAGHPVWLWVGGIVPALMFTCLCVFLWRFLTRPRLAFDGEHLVMNVGKSQPVRVPIEFVEGFLLGKGPAFLNGKDDKRTETSTLIVRLAERAPEFEKLPTNVTIAAWCGHYVTLRGTWTEPLSLDVVNRLNLRLHDVQHGAATPEPVTS